MKDYYVFNFIELKEDALINNITKVLCRLGKKLINYLQEHPVKKIIYVSCNPSTLAKNCNHLQKKYHILSIQPLDMFPQTANVECVVCLERR